MLICCSITNSSILLGVFEEDRLVFQSRLTAIRERTADEYAFLLDGAFRMHRTDPALVTGAIIASVVRPLTAVLADAIHSQFGITPLVVGPGVKTGLNIKTDIPSQVGADIVVNVVAALSLVPGPLVVVDVGTATTLTGVNGQGELCGVMICPGVQTSLDALSARAAELPSMSLDTPRALLGKNTHDALTSGFIHGQAAMVKGLLDQIATEWDTMDLSVIATGDLADRILPFCEGKHRIRHEPDLSLIGLKLIQRLNTRRGSANPRRGTHES